jgi:hypothetical protein
MRAASQTVTHHKVTSVLFSSDHVLPELLTWLTNMFSKLLSLEQETRPYVSGFPLGCCDHKTLWSEQPNGMRSEVSWHCCLQCAAVWAFNLIGTLEEHCHYADGLLCSGPNTHTWLSPESEPREFLCAYHNASNLTSQVGMEFWARWAHRALWHASLWNMHEVSWRCFENSFCFVQIIA